MPQNTEPSALRCAIRTLREEVVNFSFDYPLEVDVNAGPRDSLHYYVYSDRLTWGAMRMDSGFAAPGNLSESDRLA